jgi:hypothetical protein
VNSVWRPCLQTRLGIGELLWGSDLHYFFGNKRGSDCGSCGCIRARTQVTFVVGLGLSLLFRYKRRWICILARTYHLFFCALCSWAVISFHIFMSDTILVYAQNIRYCFVNWPRCLQANTSTDYTLVSIKLSSFPRRAS